MRQLLSRENFELWLAGNPDIEVVIDHMKFLDFWMERLRNGGDQYVKELKDMGWEHIKLRTRG